MGKGLKLIYSSSICARHGLLQWKVLHILLKWKHVSSPTHNSWISEILQSLRLEKLRFSQKGSLTAFHKTWNPLLAYISNSVTVIPDDEDTS